MGAAACAATLACLSSAALAVAAPLTDPATPAVAPLGSLDVTLSVTGTPDASLGEGQPYVVAVTCRTVAGTVAEGSLTFDGPSTKTIGDLPVGATCTAEETTDGGADSVNVDPSAGVTIDAGAPAQITVANTFASTADPTTSTSTPRATNLDGTPAPAALPGPAPLPDDDGVPASIENGAPNGGDGNGDGIADAEQANVASLPSKYDVNGDGALNDFITIESPAGTALANARTLVVPAENPPPDGVALPAGLIDYDVHVVTPGDRADVKLFLPDGTQSSVYMLQNGEWKRFDNHSTVDDTADQVILSLADGGAGDQSGTDGVIHDPVGIAAPAPLGSFTVRNDTVPEGTGQTFSIKLQSCGTGANPVGCVDIAGKSTTLGDAVANGDEEFTFTGLTTAAGTWIRAVETVPAGWSVASVSCTGGSTQQSSTTNANGSVKINAGGTGGGECSFVNAQSGTVTLVKQTNPDGSPTAFPVHLRRCGSTNNDTACSGGAPFVTPNDASITDNNHQTWTAANITTAGGFAGRFELTEDLPSGWTLGSVACTGGNGFSLKSQISNGQRFFATSATPGIVCTFTNQGPRPGTITIKKDVAGGTDATDFAFTATGVTPTTFSLDDDGDNTNALSNQTTFNNVPAGATYTFTETVPAGWLDPPSVACTGTNNESVAGAQVSVPVASGDDITCTFTNTKLTDSTLTFHKKTLPAGTTTAFPYTLSSCTNSGTTVPTTCSGAVQVASSSFATGDGSTTNHVVTPNGPTWYRLDETSTGWNLSDLICTGASASGRDADDTTQLYVRVDGSRHADCTLTNAKAGTISVLKQTLPDGSTQPFTFSGARCGNSGATCPGTNTLFSPATLAMTDGGSGTWTPGTANANGRFRITETLPAAGWSVTSISCFSTDSSGAANISTSTANKRVDLNMSSQAATSVVCTFTNGLNGTISVHKGGTRNPSGQTGTDYANGLGGASFQYSTTAAPNTWLPLCTTDASGDCTGPAAPVAAATYNVREQPGGSPAGWTDVQSLTYGGNGSGAGNSAHSYLGTATVTASGGPAEVTMASNPLVNGRGHQFVNIKTNPPMSNECGTRIALILDHSGSIGTSLQSYKDAANGVVDTLANTPTRVQIYSFGSTATANTGLLDLSQPGDVSAAHTAITSVYASLAGGSNFDAALQAINSGFDVAMILTDGNATSWNGTVNNSGSATLNVIEATIAAANTVRTSAHVIAVGAGAGVTPTTLQVMSGPGDYVTNGLAGLQPTLDSIANRCRSRIIVKKETLPDGSPGSFPFTTSYGGGFSLADGQSNDSGLIASGTYSIAENTPVAWRLSDATCSDGSPVTAVKVDPGETVTCTFTNSKRPTVTVAKSVSPAGGGPFGFTLTGTGGSTHDVTPGTPFTFGPAGLVAETSYALTEAADPGYVQVFTGCTYSVNGVPKGSIGTAGAGASVDLGSVPAGADVTCSFTNTKRGKIIVQKETLPDGSPGSFPFTTSYGSGFSLSDGQSNDSGLLDPGTYSIAENTPAAWQLTESTCSDGSPISAVAVGAGETVTCTFTNSKRPTVTVAKSVSPAGGGPFSFKLTGTGGSTHDVTPGTPFTFGPAGLVAGTSYTLTETADPAYVSTSAGCTYSVNGENFGPIGSPGSGASVDLESVPAGADVTCSFTNVHKARIQVRKVTDPAGQPDEFTFSLNSTPPQQVTAAGDDPSATAFSNLVPANVAYAVTETGIPAGPPAWDPNGGVCQQEVAGVLTGPQVNAASVTPGPGETWTCTFTNTKRATITVKKQTTPSSPDQGFDFTLSGGPTAADPITGLTSGNANGQQFAPTTGVKPGTYTVAEIDIDAGWFLDSSSCDRADVAGDDAKPPANLQVKAGENWICTFKDTKYGQITVQKVTNPAQDPTNFDFAFTGRPGFQLAGGGSHAESLLKPGVYDISETVPAGWSLTGVTCDEAAQTPVNGKITVNLAAGENVTCTYTNTKLAQITVQKVTTPAQDPTQFAFAFTGRPGFQLAGGGSQAETNLLPGSYDITESVRTGWVLTSVVCDGVPQTPGNGKVTVTVAAGQRSSCTYTNVLNTAPFTVLKDFSDGNPVSVPVSLQCTAGSVVANDSSASESDPASFTVNGFVSAAATTCIATESNVPVGYSTSGSCSASLAAGTCTITNVLNTASFSVGKDFTDDNPADVTVGLECSAGNVAIVDPTASESDPANFTVSGFTSLAGTTCTATESNVPASYSDSGPCTASLADGACTITNTPVVVVAGVVTKVTTDSAFLRRALVAGESVHLTGRVPADCNPILRIDGETLGPVDTARNGDFDLAVGTRDLPTGKHVAEVACKNRNAVLVRKTFWIAAPISSSNILFIALASLLVLFGIGWVGLRTLAGSNTEPNPVTS